ncbi:alpha/beta fold hydrolase [Streptomyces sp. NBC_01353]|uniref:alpha/beta fold hydrolase n=1 Tax=Streptomyces sp. NBC_01353 TaxID=2903835 RepID=UPI002E37D53A|nr:alpha/beta fold hydrolase [Streptomyces sp. NBC_01353]
MGVPHLARKGYHVLAYMPRGLGLPFLPSTSGGFIDVGGPCDWADGSTVIDYAVDHLAPSTIGFFGESYGSGISQLVAAHDERVDAVVALSTWGNLGTSLYDHHTRHVKAVEALLGLTGGPVEDKFDEENRRILADFQADRRRATCPSSTCPCRSARRGGVHGPRPAPSSSPGRAPVGPRAARDAP